MHAADALFACTKCVRLRRKLCVAVKASRARFIYCPQNITAVASGDRVAVWWPDPRVDVAVSTAPPVLLSPADSAPGAAFTSGVTAVLYRTQHLDDGQPAYCLFHVTVISLGLSALRSLCLHAFELNDNHLAPCTEQTEIHDAQIKYIVEEVKATPVFIMYKAM